ncbi:putative CAMK/CAMK1 protein kinase [Monocercomonoides exilis]|uniref:putative CAMK/CAMK1 protein kinase n=1 Tax=Monocercomonoides exilis TaxID=2049356 RepID=UPI0035593E47|nr:putative CAMK/CAMK1 protein kinase [Monocercomonoides exilis]|eukprot:MONOS_12612.1-p1 / transcript=MONOS_12612.1 / gene=MONOS_12612 / organism=Monocercomonoides_exilis_PA203 / gene_product=calcium / transcript_product=calcium / location=Mono_scaffold00709:11601-12779(-) / protein_length=320 / sequence_SO=supercontig / SO=protein_coding / is_pseudo=false
MSRLPKLVEGVPSNLTENFEILELLGEGHFAKVRKARHKASGKYVAIKFIDKRQIISDPHQLISLFSEINIMKSLKHPHIIRLLDVYETDDKLCLITELATGGELFDKIVDRGSYSERDASLLMLSLFNALRYLHSKNIAHRDLKPENILYESDAPTAAVKITDFGLSKVVDKKKMMQTCCGTPGYVAPEVLTFAGYGPEVDLWSMGVLMYVLLCGFPPFYDENDAALFAQIQSGKYEFISPYWDTISAEAKDLISKLLVVDPKKRLTAEQAVSHPWFSVALPTHKLDAAHQKLTEARSKRRFKAAGMAVIIGSSLKRDS